MADYLTSGHMELAKNIDPNSNHLKIKESSSTSVRFLRPAQKAILILLLTKFSTQVKRCKPTFVIYYSLSALTILYFPAIFARCISKNVHYDYQNYQLILWHENTNEPISLYKLTTVTYGSSLFLVPRHQNFTTSSC